MSWLKAPHNVMAVLTAMAIAGTFVAYMVKGQIPPFIENLDTLLVGATAGVAYPVGTAPHA